MKKLDFLTFFPNSFAHNGETNEDIKALCADLRVLSKPGFQTLLKWRRKMAQLLPKKELKPKIETEEEKVTTDEIPLEEQKDLQLENELQNLYQQRERTKKRLRKKQKTRQYRIDKGMLLLDDAPDFQEEGLFAIKKITKFVDEVAEDNEANHVAEEIVDSDTEEPEYIDYELEAITDPEEKYNKYLEKQLNSMYESYLTKHGEAKLKHAQRKKLAKARQRDREQFENPGVPVGLSSGSFVPKLDPLNSDEDQIVEEEEEEMEFEEDIKVEDTKDDNFFEAKENSLVVQPRITKADQANFWFSQDIFQEIKDEVEVQNPKKKKEKAELKKKEKTKPATPDFAFGKKSQRQKALEESDDEEPQDDKLKWAKAKKLKLEKEEKNQNTFEVVPREWPDETYDISGDEDLEDELLDSSSDEEMDDEMKIKAMALGKAIVNDSKLRRNLEDSAYHRYAYNETDLPGTYQYFLEHKYCYLKSSSNFILFTLDQDPHCSLIKPQVGSEMMKWITLKDKCP